MKVAVAGSTGLVGGNLLELLAEDAYFTEVVALCRRPGKNFGSKVRWQVVDFDNGQALHEAVRDFEAVCCCLGTTIKRAKSKEAFRKVDFGYVLNLANAAHAAGCKKFLVVSAIGSDPESSVFYSRVKGEMEMALKAIGFEQLYIFQPSMLTGEREEFRLGERIGIAVGKLVGPLMMGSLRKYRPIAARKVARGMVAAVAMNWKGSRTFQYSDMMDEINR